MASEFTVGSYLGRWVFALALVLGTYNPTQYCFVKWAFAGSKTFDPVVAITGIVLLIGWIVYIRATTTALGLLGILLGAALFASLIWLFVDLGWLSLDSPGMITWLVLILLSLILALGMSWSHIKRRLSGQVSTDEVHD